MDLSIGACPCRGPPRGFRVFAGRKPDGTPKKQLDVTRLGHGWSADLEEGLKDTVAHFVIKRRFIGTDVMEQG